MASELIPDSIPIPIRVTALIMEQCVFCDDAKAILNRLADEYPLEIETLSMVSAEGAQLALEGDILFPPGIFLDGEPFSYGRLSERKLRRELERRHVKRNGRAALTKQRDPARPTLLTTKESAQ